jgi:hypothetical protein
MSEEPDTAGFVGRISGRAAEGGLLHLKAMTAATVLLELANK